MSESAGFYAYTDNVAKTGGTLFPYDPGTEILSCPSGATNISLPKADLARVVTAVRQQANQDLTDRAGEPTENVYKADGSLLIAIGATIVAGPPMAVTSVSIGNSYPKVKALDWCDGVERQILGILPPAP